MDGELHVDGGLINNVPVDMMATSSNGGMVIGVDVSPPHELNQSRTTERKCRAGKRCGIDSTRRDKRRVYRPSILLVLMRVIEFGGISYRRQKAEMADVYISPEVVRFKRNDFHAADDIAEVGYHASRETLLKWLATAPESVRSLRPDLFAERS